LIVEMVVPGSSAEVGGVHVGDALIAVNGNYADVAENNTPELFAAYVTPLPRPIVITFRRCV
jgi:hypothetical protein